MYLLFLPKIWAYTIVASFAFCKMKYLRNIEHIPISGFSVYFSFEFSTPILHLEKVASTLKSIFTSLCYFEKQVVLAGLSNFVYNKICFMVVLVIQVESFKFITALQLLRFCLSVGTGRQRKFTKFYVLPLYCSFVWVSIHDIGNSQHFMCCQFTVTCTW